MKCVYVYYRIAPGREACAADAVAVLLSMMAAHCSAPPRRFVRCDDPSTWLERYEGIEDLRAFEAALDAATRKLDCMTFTEGGRHLECFAPTPHKRGAHSHAAG